MDKNVLVISKRLKFPYNDRTDKNIIAQPKMNLQSFKGTPDGLKQRFTGSERKPSLGAPECSTSLQSVWAVNLGWQYVSHFDCNYHDVMTLFSIICLDWD